jgi:hypothetical protein
MRALATNRFGGNDVLELTEVPDPIVGPDTGDERYVGEGTSPLHSATLASTSAVVTGLAR